MPDTTERRAMERQLQIDARRSLRAKLAWFVGLWLAGLAAVFLLARAIGFALGA